MKHWIICIFLFSSLNGFVQDRSDTASIVVAGNIYSLIVTGKDSVASQTNVSLKKKRIRYVAGVHAISYAGTLAILGQAWYKDFPKVPFHLFDDSKEWLQVDKVGHGWTAYNIAKYSSSLWQWAGLSQQKSVLLGGISSLGYQTILEYFDAHSPQWGWSWADMGANVAGAGLYVAQELAWKEQRISVKFSSHRIAYDEALSVRADNLYGKTLPERILKDYNGQTYWASFNLASFANAGRLPPWLNVAFGYGAKGLFGGFENIGYDKDGNVIFNRNDIKRQRQWYLSPDVDFTKIRTNKKGLRTLLSVLNMIKMPAPAFEISGGKLRGHLLFF